MVLFFPLLAVLVSKKTVSRWLTVALLLAAMTTTESREEEEEETQ